MMLVGDVVDEIDIDWWCFDADADEVDVANFDVGVDRWWVDELIVRREQEWLP